MTKAETLFHQIASELPDAKEGKMFGSLCMKAPNGKAAVIFKNDDMVFKLEAKELDKAMDLKGAKVFDPMDGRPMKGWVQLSYEHADKWKKLAGQAIDYVKTLEK